MGKDPNRRKSRPGSRVRANRVDSRARPERPSSSGPAALRGALRPNASQPGETFVLYVEGARDREILECWARRIDPRLARCIERNTVILGGRRPARAIRDFQKRGGRAAGYSGLIVLDGDDLPRPESIEVGVSCAERRAAPERADFLRAEGGLEVFVWSLRHIESYLLVPAAIRRMLKLAADDRSVERLLEIHSSEIVSNADPTPRLARAIQHRSRKNPLAPVGGSLHAKRILGAGGSLSKALGSELRAGDIARAMRLEDLHQDVRRLFTRMGALAGLAVDGPQVVIRPS